MKKNLCLLILSSFLLFSCTNSTNNNNDDIKYNQNEEQVTCISGAFGKENKTYTSKKINSLCLLDTHLESGTFSFDIVCGNNLQENGVVFNYKNESNYYFIGFDLTSSIIINEVMILRFFPGYFRGI